MSASPTMHPSHTYRLHDEAGTDALGGALAHILQPGLAIYLHGDLGVGKTALTRALLHAAGYSGHVKSPTYTLAEPYTIPLGDRMVTLIHFDLYRMLSADEFLEAGFREHFNPETICIVEWPEKGDTVLPRPDIEIALSVQGHGRKVELRALSDKGLECLARLKFAPNL
jgi:tRNA threonylcarbamoyladenosine biosynthesis protein TsaE